VTNPEQVLHLGPPQVKIAVFQAKRLRHFGSVLNLEGRRLGLIENLDGIDEHLDFTRRQVRVFGFRRPSGYLPVDRHDTLGPKRVGCLVDAGVPLRIEHYLRQTGSIPQVDEEQTPVIAPPLHPPHQAHRLADFG
jgi:hypothetical protein